MNKAPWVVLGLFLMGCGVGTPSKKKYYFPYPDLVTPKVYVFTAEHDDKIKLYWHLKTTIKENDTLVTTSVYSPNFVLTERFVEQINKEGSILREVDMSNDTGLVKGKIEEDQVYHWAQGGDEKLYFSFKYPGPKGEQHIIKERSTAPGKHDISYQGNVYVCIRFDDTFTLNNKMANRTETTEQYRNSYYAEGIGLITYETFYPNGSSIRLSLAEIIDEDTFNQRKLENSKPPSDSKKSK